MTILQLFILISIFFLTSIISVVTASTSLITVAAMFQVGIEPRTALATYLSHNSSRPRTQDAAL